MSCCLGFGTECGCHSWFPKHDTIPDSHQKIQFFSFWFLPSSPHNWDLCLVLHYFNYYIFMSSTFTFIVSARFRCYVNLNWTFQRQKKVVFLLFLNWVLFSLPSFNVLHVFMELCQPDSSIKILFMKPKDLDMQSRNRSRSYCIWVKPWQLTSVQP